MTKLLIRYKVPIFIAIIWTSANLIAYYSIDRWEKSRLSQKYNVPVWVLDEYKECKISIDIHNNQKQLDVWYRLLKPKQLSTTNKLPLFVYLHGSGGRGNDNCNQLNGLPVLLASEPYRLQYPCYILVPQCPQEMNWSSFFQIGGNEINNASLNPILAILEELTSKYSIDPNKIYLCGYSMGGYGSWALACEMPDTFAAVIPIAGGGDETKVVSMINTAVWCIHSKDDEAVPVNQSRRMIETLKKAGGKPNYTEYENAGHASWVPAFKESTEIMNWIFNQQLLDK